MPYVYCNPLHGARSIQVGEPETGAPPTRHGDRPGSSNPRRISRSKRLVRQKHLTNRHSTTNAPWANANSGTNILLQFDDGTYGGLDSFQVMPFQSNMAAYVYNSGSSPNKYAMKFQLPFPPKVDALVALAAAAAVTSTFNAILYDGTTSLASVAIDPHTWPVVSARPVALPLGQEVALQANYDCYLSLQPSTANNVSLYYGDVPSNIYLGATSLVITTYSASRSEGAWSTLNTPRPYGSLRISSADDGTGSGSTIFLAED